MSKYNVTAGQAARNRSMSPRRNQMDLKNQLRRPTDLLASKNLHRFHRELKPIQFQQPFELGHFSYDINRVIKFDDSSLNYLILPLPEHTDLSAQFENRIEKDPSINEHIDGLLTGIDHLVRTKQIELDRFNFISYRGMINKINISYYDRSSWRLNLIKYKDIIFIDNGEFEKKLEENSNQSDRQKLMGYWGYKFESISTCHKPLKALDSDQETDLLRGRLDEIVNTRAEFCSIFKTKVGEFRLLMGAEVDCWNDDPNLDPSNMSNRLDHYVELKTSRIIETERQRNNFEKHKLLKFWSQSFLAGIPEVIVGFRDDNGHLKKIERYPTLKIPKLVHSRPGAWDPNICLNFLHTVLKFIQDGLQNESNEIDKVYELHYSHDSNELKLNWNPRLKSFITDDFLKNI